MAKQKTDATNNASSVEIVEAVEVTVVPAEKTNVVLFDGDKSEKLIKAFISSEVVRYDKTREDCEGLAKKYLKLRVKDKDDKAGYELVKAAYNEAVKIRTGTDKKRKELGAPYDAIKKGINDHANDNIIGVLSASEKHLKTEKEKYEAWEAEETERKKKEAEALLKARIDELKENGMIFEEAMGLYSIGENISVDAVSIQKYSETDYKFFLAKVQAEKKRIDAEKAEADRIAAEEAQRQKDEAERIEREAKELRDEKVEAREDKLAEIGLTQNREQEFFGYESLETIIKISYDEVAKWNKTEFSEKLQEISSQIEADKKRISDASDVSGSAPENLEPEKPMVPVNNDVPVSRETKTGGGSTRPATDTEIDEIRFNGYYDEMNKTAIPQMLTTGGAEIVAEFRNAVKLAYNNAIEKFKS